MTAAAQAIAVQDVSQKLSSDEWDSRRKADDDVVAELEGWLKGFDGRCKMAAEAAAAADGAQKEKLRLFRTQLAMDMAEERNWAREEDRRREEEEMNHLAKVREEDEFAAAVLRVMSKGTVEARQRTHEQTIVDRRHGVTELKRLAAERRAAHQESAAAENTAHADRLSKLEEDLQKSRVLAEEERRNRAQQWDEVLAERRRRERAREREREHRRMKEEQSELAHQRIVEHEWRQEKERLDCLSKAKERMRLIEGGELSRLKEKRYRELMAAKQEFLDHAAAIGDMVRSQIGHSSCLGMLAGIAEEGSATEGKEFGGIRKLLGATLRTTHLSPAVGDPGVEGLLRGVPMCDKEVQTVGKGAKGGAGGKAPRGGSAGKK